MIKTISFTLNGQEMADEFWELSAAEQADFFNQNGFCPNNYNHGYALIQIDRITEMFDENGKEFVTRLYESMKGWESLNMDGEMV